MSEQDRPFSEGSGLACFTVILQYLRVTIDPDSILREYGHEGQDLSPMTMVRAAKKQGLRARKTRIKRRRLETTPFPIIAWDQDYNGFIIAAVRDDQVLIQEPGKPPVSLGVSELWERWQGDAILITSRELLPGITRKFDMSWFIPVVVKYRKMFRDVIIASFFLQLFALMTPLVFQVVMDKVLVHRAVMTLEVLFIALLCIGLFEVVLEGLRTYIFSHTTSRVDVELGAELFRHLLRLPIAFFNSRPVGVVVARVRELENIRNFLTSSALTLLLDVLFSFVFIIVMFFYSERLAWIVVASLPFYVLISILITPELRKRAEEQFQRGAINQAFLTESLTGVETLKSMAVEPQMQARWEEQLSAYARSSFRAVVLGMYGGQSVQLVSKMVMALLMWQGSLLVINNQLSIGELIAFNMFSGQVATPILRLAQLWQDYQQFRISMERLGDVLNVLPESAATGSQPPMPQITGRIEFDQVVFRYQPMGKEILRFLTLDIPAGQVLGIAGRSGSGKSTLTKLVQRLYLPESGKVLIDGNNLALIDPAWLRHQIGVVLQDSMLFNRSIRENIALANPALPVENIIEAATMAGAHDFILELPQGYETPLGERGLGLSGGQLQRIAIARALVTNPRILILDEATSALDYESEKVIQDNMQQICRNRTVIIIAHRLSTICRCDRIVVMDNGQLVEAGTHHELLEQNGHYASLWQAQNLEVQS